MKLKYTLLFILFFGMPLFSQEPSRVGTTAANFLELGYGTAGSAMGDAYVSIANDLSAIYWNPAGLAKLRHNQVMALYQPWVIDINSSMMSVGIHMPSLGTMALGIINVDYGEMEVTTLDMQNGTGELFSAKDLAFTLSFARGITDWFAFGTSAKYVSSSIWHSNAGAFAMDMGVQIKTGFLAHGENREHGLNIGMSISNYGTRMKYDGIDLLVAVDIDPNEGGNFGNAAGQFRLQDWELPLLFRIGMSFSPIVAGDQKLTVALDALHPNNNGEYVNAGVQYSWRNKHFGTFYLRGGYKALFLEDSQFGPSFGFGIDYRLNNAGVQIDYGFRDIGILGNVHAFGLGLSF